MKYILPSLFIIGIMLVSCNAEPTGEAADGIDETIEDPDVVSTVTDFEDSDFDNPDHVEILRELDVCEFKSADSTYFATCSPDNFKIVKHKENASVKDAFILEMKAGIFPKDQEVPLPPVRHIIVFEREGSKLVRVNGFRGDLIEMKKNENGVNDLLLGLFDTDDGGVLFYCWFTWKDDKYVFKEIEGLDFGEGPKALKEETREETTQEIYQTLMDKSLIF